MRFKVFTIFLLMIMSGCKDKGATTDANSVIAGRGSKPWIEIGSNSASGEGVSNNAGESMSPAVAVWRLDNPIVCWSNSVGDETDRRFGIYVKRWNGSSWIEMGANSASGAGISNTDGNSTDPEIIVNREGDPVICWREEQKQGTHPISQIFVKRWNGSAWVEMGRDSATGYGISDNESYCSRPSIAINSEGNPIICWAVPAGKDVNIRLKRWDSRGWSEIDSIPVLIQDTKKAVGTDTNVVTSIFRPVVQVAKDGKPVVCWADCSGGNYEIYVKQWDVNEWKEMGKDSASNSGISGNSGASVNPVMTVDWDGMPIICWEDDTNGNKEIYVRRWNGFDWIEISSGSASGGGVSDDAVNSSIPDICINQEGAPVICWISGSDIILSRWNGSSWVKIGEGAQTKGDSVNNPSGAGKPAVAIDSEGNAIVVFDSLASESNREIYVRQYPSRLVQR